MLYNQWLSKHKTPLPLLFIVVTSILVLSWLPSTALALGIGSANMKETSTVNKSGSDSSRIKAPTNIQGRKYVCLSQPTGNSSTTVASKIVVSCGMPYDQQVHSCPAGQVLIGTGSEDRGRYSDPYFHDCNAFYTSRCAGSKDYWQIVGTTTPCINKFYGACLQWGTPVNYYCKDYCQWSAVWTPAQTCYISCAPMTNSCSWQ